MLSNLEKRDSSTLLLLDKSPGWTPSHHALPKTFFWSFLICKNIFSFFPLIILIFTSRHAEAELMSWNFLPDTSYRCCAQCTPCTPQHPHPSLTFSHCQGTRGG